MIPTFIGLLTCALGLWLSWRGSPMTLVCTMLAMSLLEASAAFVLPALSYSSIPPPRVMLLFLLIAVARRLQFRASLLKEALLANAPLLVFATYGAISAFTLPYIFAGQINVVPLRPVGLRHLTDTFPLRFSPQNITTAFYLLGTGLASVAAYVAARLATEVRPLVRACVAITLTQAVTGAMGAMLAGTPWDSVVDFVRNGSYSQVHQTTNDFVRIAGFMTEPSAYSRVGSVWLIFSFELWLRRISPKWTGPAALAIAAVLAFSTSSTAYFSMAAYAVILAARFLTFPKYLDSQRLLTITLCGLLACIGTLSLVLFFKPFADVFVGMLDQMTTQKAATTSGQQRLFWAMQGFNAFVASGGLGIGAGSFRSSSLIMAIIGSLGVVGTLAFAATCASLLVRTRPTPDRERGRVSEAAAWAAVGSIIPQMVMGGSPDPGMEFATLTGLALALRRPAIRSRTQDPALRWGSTSAGEVKPITRPQSVPQSIGWRRFAK